MALLAENTVTIAWVAYIIVSLVTMMYIAYCVHGIHISLRAATSEALAPLRVATRVPFTY